MLFEGPDPTEAFAISQLLDRMDVDTMWCPGPHDDGEASCPLVEGGRCGLLEKADVVINNIGTRDAQGAAVAHAVDEAIGDKKAVIFTTRRQPADVLENCRHTACRRSEPSRTIRLRSASSAKR